MNIKVANHNNEMLRHYVNLETITFKEITRMTLLTARLHITQYRLVRAWRRQDELLAKLNTEAEALDFREELKDL